MERLALAISGVPCGIDGGTPAPRRGGTGLPLQTTGQVGRRDAACDREGSIVLRAGGSAPPGNELLAVGSSASRSRRLVDLLLRQQETQP